MYFFNLLSKGRPMIHKNLGLVLLLSSFFIHLSSKQSHENDLIQNLKVYSRNKLSPDIFAGLEKLANPDTPRKQLPLENYGKFPLLFEHYPALKTKIAYVSFCDLPTPVIDCKLAQQLGIKKLYVKDDGQTGKKIGNKIPFGGNKPRKLEFLLGDALWHDHNAVIGRGGTGTNFGLAAAIYAQLLGMDATLILAEQDNCYTVQRNILLMLASGAHLRVAPNSACHFMAYADEFLKHKTATGKFPYLLPTGGSHPLGVLGLANAIFELYEQIKAGTLEKPDYIYAAIGNGTGGQPGYGRGSGGTITGLLLGLMLTGLDCQLVAVHVEPEMKEGEVLTDIQKLFRDANELLHDADPSIPLFDFPMNRFSEVKGFCGPDYGVFTKEGMDARSLLYESDKIKLDGTYTSKAFAGMLDMIKTKNLQKAIHLFWDGYCAGDFEDVLAAIDYKKGPKALHHYFEEPVQKLDVKL